MNASRATPKEPERYYEQLCGRFADSPWPLAKLEPADFDEVAGFLALHPKYVNQLMGWMVSQEPDRAKQFRTQWFNQSVARMIDRLTTVLCVNIINENYPELFHGTSPKGVIRNGRTALDGWMIGEIKGQGYLWVAPMNHKMYITHFKDGAHGDLVATDMLFDSWVLRDIARIIYLQRKAFGAPVPQPS